MVAWRTENIVMSRVKGTSPGTEQAGEGGVLETTDAPVRAHPIVKANAFTVASDAGAADQESGVLHLLSLVGRRVAVEAVAHALLTGKAQTLVYPDPLRDGFAGFAVHAPQPWGWRLPRRRLQTGDTHLVLRPARADVTRVREPAFTIVQPPEGAERVARIHYLFLSQAVATPLAPAWETWLWTRALATSEATPLSTWGDLPAAWACQPDEARLREDIVVAIRGSSAFGLLPVPRGEACWHAADVLTPSTEEVGA
jgi:hypothetical protein